MYTPTGHTLQGDVRWHDAPHGDPPSAGVRRWSDPRGGQERSGWSRVQHLPARHAQRGLARSPPPGSQRSVWAAGLYRSCLVRSVFLWPLHLIMHERSNIFCVCLRYCIHREIFAMNRLVSGVLIVLFPEKTLLCGSSEIVVLKATFCFPLSTNLLMVSGCLRAVSLSQCMHLYNKGPVV